MRSHQVCRFARQFVMLRQNYIPAYHADVLRALSRIPSPLPDEQKKGPCRRPKLPPISKILVVVIESIRFLKCVHSLFEYCRSYGILASESVNTASENLNYLNIALNQTIPPLEKKLHTCFRNYSQAVNDDISGYHNSNTKQYTFHKQYSSKASFYEKLKRQRMYEQSYLPLVTILTR